MQPIPPYEVSFEEAYRAWAFVSAAHQQVSQHITHADRVTAGPWWPAGESWTPHPDPRMNMKLAIELLKGQLRRIEMSYSELGDHLPFPPPEPKEFGEVPSEMSIFYGAEDLAKARRGVWWFFLGPVKDVVYRADGSPLALAAGALRERLEETINDLNWCTLHEMGIGKDSC